MIDETFHTDRDVGEFIEGRRSPSPERVRRVRNRQRSSGGLTPKNAALLDMIEDMEAQLDALSGQNAAQERLYDGQQTTRDQQAYSVKRTRRAPAGRSLRDTGNSEPSRQRDSDGYGSALERIEAQLKRVDEALDNKRAEARARQDIPRNTPAMGQRRRGNAPSAMPASSSSLHTAIRDIKERAHDLGVEWARTEDHVPSRPRTQRPTAPMSSMAPAQPDASELQSSLDLLRADVSALRELLDEVNFSGTSEHLLNEIAALSGRIDKLTSSMSASGQDPDLMDAIRDIHALLDRPAQDPAIDMHFERVLNKLDGLPVRDHYEDFAKLSAQIDNLRDMLSAAPRAQHFSNLSGQMGMLVERLGSLEDDVRRNAAQMAKSEEKSELEERLAYLQEMMERLDPNDRLMRLEHQLVSLADQLEQADTNGDIAKPLEMLARQVESLVQMVDQRTQDDQSEVLEMLAGRISDLDRRIQEQSQSSLTDQRFDQVEQTLARIDDMLANRMESANFTSLESGLSRLADRIESHEETLRSNANSSPNAMELDGLSKLEAQIADLADRLGNVGGGNDDREFYETLTNRLDALTAQFAASQKRFDAVDRLGSEIQQLATRRPDGPVDEAKMAEAAALKALQKAGPLSAGSSDGTLEAIMDGLKDDLHGLRKLAENNENSTQKGLISVSSMLNTIVERLGMLEEEVRAEDRQPRAGGSDQAPVHMRIGANEEDETGQEGARGIGRLLRRDRKGKAAPAADRQPQSSAQSLSAAELLAARDNRQQSGASRTPRSAGAGNKAATAQSGGAAQRQPGISLSGKAVSLASSNEEPQARKGQTAPQVQPQSVGNTALQHDPEPTPASATPPRQTARIVGGNSQGPARRNPMEEGPSKADFIAAARRAAQAAAQESERVEKEDGEKRSFFSRFKGNKKAKQGKAEAVAQQMDANLEGMNRKDRRATIAQAARKAKQIKEEKSAQQTMGGDEQTADLAFGMHEDEEARRGLFAKLGGALSRHSRPLLMAAAAILLAITTLQLAQNPNSSLHSLFNPAPAGDEQTLPDQAPSASEDQATPSTTVAPEDQSSLTPSSGNLMREMSGEEASRAITFAQSMNSADSLTGPRSGEMASAIAGPTIENAERAGLDVAQSDAGIDMTPTSSIPSQTQMGLTDPSAAPVEQPMPPMPITEDASSDALLTSGLATGTGAADPSVQAAIEMNNLLAPGVADTPLMQAAKSGDALAQFEMGRRLTLGEGISVDLKKAADWFEKAAEQSMPQAQYSLANLYEKGKGVKKDLQVARLWYERAAKLGNVKAMHNLAVLYAEGGLGKPDFKQAAEWFVKASDHGLKDSQYNLAILYARGMGVKQDLLQSYKWFAIAAKGGDQGAASKRDEVLGVLNRSQQKTAKTLVEVWVPKVAKPSANNLATIPDAWKLKAPEAVNAVTGSNNTPSVDAGTVAKTQSMLGALGYNAGPADGQMGPRTRTAIRNFQETAGLPVTGQIDSALLEALSLRVI